MKEAKDSDMIIQIEGVGDFRYAVRTLGDNLKIRSEFLKILDGVSPETDAELSGFASIFAAHKVLCVSAPAGWEDLMKVDESLHADPVSVVLTIWEKLQEKQDSFRNKQNHKG